MRTETDSLGSLDIPDQAYYGIQSFRASQHFLGSEKGKFPLSIYHALIKIKTAAFLAMRESGLMQKEVSEALLQASKEALKGKFDESFIIPATQGGAGTSVNMNVNEVLTNRALELLGHSKGEYQFLHPNDDTNRFQSTNDVFPGAIRLAAFEKMEELERETAKLQTAFQIKEQEFADLLKPARTEFQEAVPITLGQEFGAWAEAFARDRWRVFKMRERIRQVNLGGTAVGTGINAPKIFIFKWIEALRNLTGIQLAAAENKIDNTQNADLFVEVSGILKSLATNLIKIGNDLRLLSSGPRAGFGEIQLPAAQPGSSIMPWKINPVIPEFAVSCGFEILSHDLAITQAANFGSLELNAFLPTIGYHLILSIEEALSAVISLRSFCIEGIQANKKRLSENLKKSQVMATLLTPYLGYARVSELLKESLENNKDFNTLVVEDGKLSEEDLKEIFKPRKASSPGIAGSKKLSHKIIYKRN